MYIVVHKGKHYRRKKAKTFDTVYSICKDKCCVNPGSKKCEQTLMDHCGEQHYFVKVGNNNVIV